MSNVLRLVLPACAAYVMMPLMAAAAGPRPEYAHVLHHPQWYEQQRHHEHDSGTDVAVPRAQNATGFASTNNMTYQGGSVMLTFTAYAIYWAPGTHTISSTYENLIDRWFTDLGGTSLYNIVTQYYEGSPPTHVQNVATLGGAWVDSVNPYPHAGTGADPLLDSDIQAEVARAIAVNHWPNGGLNVAFFVFTAKGIESCADSVTCTIGTAHPVYCAYHSGFFTGFSDVIIYANMPYAGTWSSGYPYTCGDAFPSPNGNADADEEISITSHEQFESATDPLGDAWYDAAGNEIGDKCAYLFGSVAPNGSNVTLNGDPYIVQQEWSNAVGGCALAYGSVPTPATTNTPTRTPTATATRTAIKTNTPTPTAPPPTATRTPTNRPTNTSTAAPTASLTPRPTNTIGPTRTSPPPASPTATPATGCCHILFTSRCSAPVSQASCRSVGGSFLAGGVCNAFASCVKP